MRIVLPSRWMGRRKGWMGGYDAFIEKKSANVSCVSFLFCFIFCAFTNSLAFSSSLLRRKSLQMTKSLTHLMGGYLPNTITEMWEPSRDCIFPTSDGWCDERCGAFWVGFLLPFVFFFVFFLFKAFLFFLSRCECLRCLLAPPRDSSPLPLSFPFLFIICQATNRNTNTSTGRCRTLWCLLLKAIFTYIV